MHLLSKPHNLIFPVIGLCILLVVLVLLTINFVDVCSQYYPDFDSMYNASVSANFYRHGQYRTSYPDELYYYNMITTGPIVLLPTALLFSIWGINAATLGAISFCFLVLSILAAWILINVTLPKFNLKFIISALLIAAIVMNDKILLMSSTMLWGESASLFFILLALIFLHFYRTNKKWIFVFFTGVCVCVSLFTKSSTLCVFCVFVALLFFESLIFKKIPLKHFFIFVLGIIIAWVCQDLYKLVTLGSFDLYLNWYYAEIQNILSQSKILYVPTSFSDKCASLNDTFSLNYILAFVFIYIPVLIYVFRFIYYLLKREDVSEKYDLSFIQIILGVVGSSLLIYMLFFGNYVLTWPRREMINEVLLKFYFAYFLIWAVFKLSKYRQLKACYVSVLSVVCVAAVAVSFASVFSFFNNNRVFNNGYVNKQVECDSYSIRKELTDKYIEDLSCLENNSQLYCYDWYQAPEASVFLDKNLKNIAKDQDIDFEKSNYLIFGPLGELDYVPTIEKKFNIKLDRVNDTYSFNEEELSNNLFKDTSFGIYKISKQ